MTECNICCEKLNKTTRKPVECQFCHHTACRSCIKTYMFGSIQDPCCMSCKVPWSIEFLTSTFPKTFVDGDLRAHQEKVLLEREKALLPETQLEIQRHTAASEAHAIARLGVFYQDNRRYAEAKTYFDKARTICESVGIELPMIMPTNSRTRASEPSKPVPVRSCIDEGCRGFIMKGTWACGLCHKKVCKKCMAEMPLEENVEHTCNAEDVETTNLLLNNTKPCPGCGIMISKVDGCSQMWCINCHITFDWQTLEKITSRIHNPHYYEWLRRNGKEIPREPGDIPMLPHQQCHPLPNIGLLIRLLRSMDAPSHVQKALPNAVVVAIHIEDVELRERLHGQREWDPVHRRYTVENVHRKLRKMYLQGALTEEEWKRKLYLENRKVRREQDIRGVFEIYLLQVREIFPPSLMQPVPSDQQIAGMYDALCTLRDYCNDAFRAISRTYGTMPYTIDLAEGTVRQIRP